MELAENGDVKQTIWGESLPVENVQALAASKDLREIPQRYVRPEIMVEHDVNNTDDEDCIPIVDMARLLELVSSADEAAKLKLACEEWGFFQLINHGVPDEVISSMKDDIEEFFQLPLEEKKAFAQVPGSIEGYGQAFVVSDDQKLDWGDMYFLGTQPVTFWNRELWATHPPTFRTTLDKYSLELKRVADCLLGLMATNLGLCAEKFVDQFKNGLQTVRMNYYPPSPHANKVLGLSPHSDAAGLTLLLQVNQVQGLQIRRNGSWITIKPIPGAFIVNIGDILEILSNGKYKSIEHRAIINPEKERLSIAGFHSPSYPGAIIGPLPELVEGGEEHYRTLSFERYLRMILSNKLDGKSLLDQMKLKK